MKPRHIVVATAVVAAVGVLAAAGVTVLARTVWSDDPVAADAPPLGTEVAPELIAALERDLGLSEDEARQRLHTEAWAGQTAAALRRELGEERYAGAWLTDDADQLMVAVTDEEAAEQVRAAGAEPAVVGHGTAYLQQVLATLDEHTDEIIQTAEDLAASVAGWHIELSSNTVVVHAPPEAEAIAQQVSDIAGSFSDAVKIVVSDERPTLLNDVRGGDGFLAGQGSGKCSVGFAVVGGYVTAGHCALAGGDTADMDGQPQGEFVAASFPGVDQNGPDDWGVVAVYEDWTPQPVVNDYDGGTLPVAGSVEAPVGASVCRYGDTTGVSCGVIEAYDATVVYPEGTVSGMVRTSACAEPGDSGGAWLSGDQAQGVTSGGSGDCTVGGTTYYQPLNEILELNDLTLATTGGEDSGVEAPEGGDCDAYEYTFQGQLAGSEPVAVEPSGRYYRTVSTGTHTVCLAGPDGADFGLALQRWDGEEWNTVAHSDDAGADELISHHDTPGYYRIGIVSDGDTGGYALGLGYASD